MNKKILLPSTIVLIIGIIGLIIFVLPDYFEEQERLKKEEVKRIQQEREQQEQKRIQQEREQQEQKRIREEKMEQYGYFIDNNGYTPSWAITLQEKFDTDIEALVKCTKPDPRLFMSLKDLIWCSKFMDYGNEKAGFPLFQAP